MNLPSIDIFQWLETRASKAAYNLAYSNIPGIGFEDFSEMTGYQIPSAFDLNKSEQTGAEMLTAVLCENYDCEESSVVSTTGGSEANFLVFLSLLEPGDEVIVEQPGYEPLWKTPTVFGTQVRFWERRFEDNYQLDLEALKEIITRKTKLIVLTNLHNPSGVLASRESLKGLSEIAQDHDTQVLIDEIFLDGVHPRPSSAFGYPNIIITSSMTKIYGIGGLRTGWIIAEPSAAKGFQKAKAHTSVCSPYLSEMMTAHLLKHGREQALERYQKTAQSNRKIVRTWIEENTGIIDWVEPDGGIICFLKYQEDISSVELCERLFIKKKVLIIPGLHFKKEGFFRVSYGIENECINKSLKLIKSFFSF